MQTDHKAFGILRKEWRARRWVLAGLAGLIWAGTFALFAQAGFHALPFGALFFLLAAAGLGVTLFAREERDPARALLYQVPLSRHQILTEKLRALLGYTACLFLPILPTLAVGAAVLSLRGWTGDEILGALGPPGGKSLALMLLLAVLAAPLFALVGVIVSQHVRSVIVSLILALLIALPMAAMAALPLLTPLFVDSDNRLNDPPWHIAWSSVPRVGSLFLVLAALFCGWLYFLYCRTRVHELRPTPRALLAFVFGVAAIEITFTLVFTGWRDLAYLVFGI